MKKVLSLLAIVVGAIGLVAFARAQEVGQEPFFRYSAPTGNSVTGMGAMRPGLSNVDQQTALEQFQRDALISIVFNASIDLGAPSGNGCPYIDIPVSDNVSVVDYGAPFIEDPAGAFDQGSINVEPGITMYNPDLGVNPNSRGILTEGNTKVGEYKDVVDMDPRGWLSCGMNGAQIIRCSVVQVPQAVTTVTVSLKRRLSSVGSEATVVSKAKVVLDPNSPNSPQCLPPNTATCSADCRLVSSPSPSPSDTPTATPSTTPSSSPSPSPSPSTSPSIPPSVPPKKSPSPSPSSSPSKSPSPSPSPSKSPSPSPSPSPLNMDNVACLMPNGSCLDMQNSTAYQGDAVTDCVKNNWVVKDSNTLTDCSGVTYMGGQPMQGATCSDLMAKGEVSSIVTFESCSGAQKPASSWLAVIGDIFKNATAAVVGWLR